MDDYDNALRKLEGMNLVLVEAERNSRIAVLGMEYMIRKLNSGSIKGVTINMIIDDRAYQNG